MNQSSRVTMEWYESWDKNIQERWMNRELRTTGTLNELSTKNSDTIERK